jgi:hypothetical protein
LHGRQPVPHEVHAAEPLTSMQGTREKIVRNAIISRSS